jgi:hypothetical protein
MTLTSLARPSYMPKYKPDASCVLYLEGQQDPQSTTIKDLSGYGNHGTLSGATWVREKSGVISNYFDATDDQILITSPTNLGMQGQAFTFLMWINPTTITGGAGNWRQMLGGDAGGSAVFGLRTSQSGKLSLSKQGVADCPYSNFIPSVGVWQQVGVTYNTQATVGNLNYFMNGVMDTPMDKTLDFVAGKITKTVGVSEGFYGGYIGLLRIYLSILSATQIAGIFHQERHLFGV